MQGRQHSDFKGFHYVLIYIYWSAIQHYNIDDQFTQWLDIWPNIKFEKLHSASTL